MTKYRILNVKLSNSQLDKSNLGIKKGTEVTLKLSSNAVGEFNNETSFPDKLFLTNTEVSRLRKEFSNGLCYS